MISSQVIQNTIDELHTITKVDFSVMDIEGNEVASTMQGSELDTQAVVWFAGSPADSQVIQNLHFFKVFDDKKLEYILISKGAPESAYMMGRVAAFQIQNLIVAYRERFDKNNFIQNLLLDNMLAIDVYNRARKLHIDAEARRIVFLIETKYEKDNAAMEIVKNLFGSRTKDFITAVDEKSIILVQELSAEQGYDDVEQTAKVLRDMLNSEAMSSVKIAYGTIVGEIMQVSRSYKEAKMALNVGKIFYMEKTIVCLLYTSSGSRRIISRYLISPGAIKRMLCNTNQLHMRISHIFYIIYQSMRKFSVIIISAFLFSMRMFPPAPRMYLIDRDRTAVLIKHLSFLHPCRIRPPQF